MPPKVVVIGAGLGGLECAYILAKNGLDVTVLEQDIHIGGCLQSFRRGDTLFDAGFHYIGGLREGESLYPLFRYFNLLNLPWQALDEDCFDEVVIGDRSFALAVGHERFAETLTAAFPHEKEGIRRYTAFLKQVGDHILDTFQPREAADFFGESLFARSAYDFLTDTIHDPLLRKVLSGSSLKMELAKDTLPLYVFAQINNSFIQSAWRIRGGGQQIADHLAEDIRRFGGQVRTHAKVTAIIEKDGRVTGVRVNDEEFIEATHVICDIHPKIVMALLAESQSLRRIYRRRIESLEETYGMFTANIRLKQDALPYLNRNIFVHRPEADLWTPDTMQVNSLMVSFYPGQSALDLLTPLQWSQVSQWADHRDEAYEAFKQQKTEECILLAEQRLPELRGAIEQVYTSTPLTYQRYTHTYEGSAYGIRKDWRSPMTTVLAPKLPIENVLLTGQNLNLHGVLGVSMTSVITAAQLIGMDTIVKSLNC
ncbi:MAG: NAD(P)/FAD-dependent oxidoreductase [Paludibacteraceae bacterium]|nr:NAD(P)/FAD-dependent oxidoreductase [Paludibacteraceae bacterium]